MGELYLGNYSLGNEHLCMGNILSVLLVRSLDIDLDVLHADRPLASDFDIRSGRVEVQVPDEFYCCYECILVCEYPCCFINRNSDYQ